MRRFIASANSKREIELRFAHLPVKSAPHSTTTRYFSGSLSPSHNRVNTLSTAFFIMLFHFHLSDVGVFLFTRARSAVDSSMYVFNWVVAEGAVSAASRYEAMELLDEVGNADVADLFTVKNFMVHFQLKTEADNMEEPVPVELEGFGEGTYEMLCERV